MGYFNYNMDYKFVIWTFLIALGFSTITAQGEIQIFCESSTTPEIIMSNIQETYIFKYDQKNSQDKVCNWIFQGDVGTMLLFRVKDQVFSNENNQSVCENTVSVYNGASESGDKILDTHCSGQSNSIAATGNVFYLRLYNGFLSKMTEFTLEVIQAKDYSQGACTKTQNLETDTTTYSLISTKDFPSFYKQETKCTWTITAIKSKVKIEMLFVDVDKKIDGGCKDWLSISNIEGGTTSVCGEDGFNFDQTYTSIENTVSLEFVSDNVEEGRGFLMQYRKLANCNQPPMIDNGVREYEDTLEGTVATYICNINYVLEDENRNTVECQFSGQWTDVLAVCIANCPEELPSVDGATWIANGYFENDTATYNCNDDFVRTSEDGSQLITCSNTAVWTDPMIVCEPGCTSPPPVIDGATYTHESSITGSEVIYTCNQDRISNGGVNKAVCEATGKWTQPGLVCSPGCFENPIAIRNTRITIERRSIGEIATYACITEKKEKKVVCKENGMWEQPNISCKDGNQFISDEGIWSLMIIFIVLLLPYKERRIIGYQILAYPREVRYLYRRYIWIPVS